ncbi:MAG: NAD-dependent deacylase [Spirochaetes bacterium]|jgi:NAD-dependent deacetylase|nr:NAD-dependent deacylase [Spirochaetota bacterium]
MEEHYRQAAEIIGGAKTIISLTGAGISVESGIPDFRSACGLWEKYDPMEYAHIDAFRRNPEKIWKMVFELIELTSSASPNPAHRALAELEKMNILRSVITQNIDNLHQAAGSRNVIEFHGNASRLDCLNCGQSYGAGEFELTKKVPRCRGCSAVLKPSVIFFGEAIPVQALAESERLSNLADAILVIGTSAVVYPASSIPFIVKSNGGRVIEMNLETTGLTHSITDVFIQGPVGTTLPELIACL